MSRPLQRRRCMTMLDKSLQLSSSFGEDQMKLPRVRIELILQVSPNGHTIFIECIIDVKFRDE